MSKKEREVSDHASADTPDTEVVGTNPGQGQPYEEPAVADSAESTESVTVTNDKQVEHLRSLGVFADTSNGDSSGEKK